MRWSEVDAWNELFRFEARAWLTGIYLADLRLPSNKIYWTFLRETVSAPESASIASRKATRKHANGQFAFVPLWAIHKGISSRREKPHQNIDLVSLVSHSALKKNARKRFTSLARKRRSTLTDLNKFHANNRKTELKSNLWENSFSNFSFLICVVSLRWKRKSFVGVSSKAALVEFSKQFNARKVWNEPIYWNFYEKK